MKLSSQGKALLSLLLMQSHHKEELLRFLPHSIAKSLSEEPPLDACDLTEHFESLSWIEPIHYSWFFEPLKRFPKEIQPLFVSVLSKEQKQGLTEMLHLQETALPRPFVHPYLLARLKKEVQDPSVSSIAILPATDLKGLLSLKRKEIIYMIDLLGIYDLAADLKQIINRDLIEKIHTTLSPAQRQFLDYCSKQPMKWVAPKLGLAGWDGSKEKLNRLLHQRGLVRLAKALVFEDPTFRWHFLHHLDTGRATLIEKHFLEKQDRFLTPYFKNQVLQLEKRLRRARG